MKLSECLRCTNHIEYIADCALCRYDHGVAYRAVDGGKVISCPLDNEARYWKAPLFNHGIPAGVFAAVARHLLSNV
jgi:hypothetical protein